jgi:DNA-binding LacI/PurR family transcriptional regulator
MMALAVPELTNPYYADLGAVVVAEAARCGYTAIIDPTESLQTDKTSEFSKLRRALVDGVILSPHGFKPELLEQNHPRRPMVLVGEPFFSAPFDHVHIDAATAVHDATAHLLQIGRRRIAAIGVADDGPWGTVRLRLHGFRQALQEAGLEPRPEYLALAGEAWTRRRGSDAMRELLVLPEPPDGIVCFNDLMALGAMRALHAAGMRIPDHIAVIGYDNIEDGRFSTPALSTIDPSKEGIARLAVAMLIERIEGQYTGPPRHVELPSRLCIRGSTVGEVASGGAPATEY